MEAKEYIEQVMQEIVDKFLIPRFHALGMNATGNWLKSLEVEFKDGKGFIRGAKYSEQLVFGRKPGKMPPASHLEKWVNAKLGIYGKEAKSIAFAISKKIAKEGTSWYKQGGSDLLEVLEEPATINFIYEKVGLFFRIHIAETLRREAKKVLENV